MRSRTALGASLLSLLALEPAARAQTYERLTHYRLIGDNVLLSERPDGGLDTCALALAPDAVIARLAALPPNTRVRVRLERLPYPNFPPLFENAIQTDRLARVRGRLVAPWCGGTDFFWIVDAQLMAPPRPIPDALRHGVARPPRP